MAKKINGKLRGVNWVAQSGHNGARSMLENFFVLGADVTHPSGAFGPLKRLLPSVAAVVGSIPNRRNRSGLYAASCRVQQARMEMVSDLGAMVEERIDDYGGRPPSKVLYMRDGVSDSQYIQVLKDEVPQIRAAYEKKCGITPSITVIIVTKRHKVRFRPADERLRERGGGPPAGSILDELQMDTDDRYFNFYLAAHTAAAKMTKPAHYIVLQDDNRLSIDHLQELCYLMCFQFGRTNSAVSYATPAYYADLFSCRMYSMLAYLLRQANEFITRNMHDSAQSRNELRTFSQLTPERKEKLKTKSQDLVKRGLLDKRARELIPKMYDALNSDDDKIPATLLARYDKQIQLPQPLNQFMLFL